MDNGLDAGMPGAIAAQEAEAGARGVLPTLGAQARPTQRAAAQPGCRGGVAATGAGVTPARQAALDAHKRRMRAAFFDRPVFCTRCRQWVDRAITHMVSIGNGRGRVEYRRHAEGA